MAWDEPNSKESLARSEDTNVNGYAMLIILFTLVFSIGLYSLGKSDGREDILKSNITNCVSVEILEDS
jgi:hypothetical protein